MLLDATGPVIIDLPQAVNAASNNNAFSMLERDVNNMRAAFARAAPELLQTAYAQEIWTLFQAGALTPETVLTGQYTQKLVGAIWAPCWIRSRTRDAKPKPGSAAGKRPSRSEPESPGPRPRRRRSGVPRAADTESICRGAGRSRLPPG